MYHFSDGLELVEAVLWGQQWMVINCTCHFDSSAKGQFQHHVSFKYSTECNWVIELSAVLAIQELAGFFRRLFGKLGF